MSGPGVEGGGAAGDVIIMVTDEGTHSSEHWAQVSAQVITSLLVVAPTADEAIHVGKREFQEALEECLTPFHEEVQANERALLERSRSHLSEPISPVDVTERATREVTAVAQQTMFAAHYCQPHVQAYVYRALGQHFANSIHIERLWCCDQNPDDEQGKSYRGKYQTA